MHNLSCPPSLPRLPPLPALRAFESAARHGSFSLAAQELNLTHGAIGHQVRSLEESMGVRLFDRVGRGLVLTNAGRAFAERVREALLDIVAATSEVRRTTDHGQLTLSVLPSFAARWLTPRLGRFNAQNPGLSLYIHTSTTVIDLQRAPVDLCIRFGVGPWEDLWCERLLGDDYYPVCAPDFLPNPAALQLHELHHAPLLCCTDEPWRPWLDAAGLDGLPEPNGLTYSDAVNLLHAAKAGQGIALARHALVKEDLRSGELVRLFNLSVASPMSYFLVATHAMAASEKVRRFRAWLWSEINATDDAPAAAMAPRPQRAPALQP